MSDLDGKKLNEIWKSIDGTNERLDKMVELLNMKRPINLQMPVQEPPEFPETISISNLYDEMKAIFDNTTLKTEGKEVQKVEGEVKAAVDFPELQKIAGTVGIDEKDIESLARALATVMPHPTKLPDAFEIKNWPDAQEVFGKVKALPQKTGADEWMTVRISDGEKFIPLEELLREIAQASAAGVGGALAGSGGGGAGDASAANQSTEITLLTAIRDYVDTVEATLGTTADAANTTGTTGSISGKMRGLVSILSAVWDNVNNVLHTNLSRVGGTAVATNAGNASAGTQRVVVATDQPAVSVRQQNSVSASTTLQNAAAATGNGTTLAVDGQSAIALTVSGTFVGTVTFEGTEDGTNYTSLIGVQLGTSNLSATATAPGIYEFSIAGLVAVRARISAYTSGNITVTGHTVPVSFSPRVFQFPSWLVSSQTALTTVITVSSAAGRYGGGSFINLNSAPAYIQVFDTTGAVTLGTTVPTFVQPIPANATPANGSAFINEIARGLTINNGIKLAATTTATGSTTVTTALIGHTYYA